MTDITLYRYKLTGVTWENISKDMINRLVKEAESLKFEGDSAETQFGFTECDQYADNILYGTFIQKFPTTLKDFDPETKEEKLEETVDSGEYFFVVKLHEKEVFLQTKRNSDLPGKETIAKRFRDLFKLSLNKLHYSFTDMLEAADEIDRDRIVKIFYDVADEVLEMDFKDFDSDLILNEKEKRGERQKYFNPIEEYQEALEEGALRSAKTVEKASVKAKKGQSLKKNPLVRAMLEGSKNPNKIVYKKDHAIITDSALLKRKVVITIEDNKTPLSEQMPQILIQLDQIKIDIQQKELKDSSQTELF